MNRNITEQTLPKIAPCLWFDGSAEEAARFYASVFPESSIDKVNHATGDWPGGKAGDVLTVEFTLCGSPFVGLNSRPAFQFNEAVSFQVYTDSQEETDRYWNAIVNNGGSENVCSWCRDKYGLNWQIVPRVLMEAISGPDRAVAKRAMDAMMTMTKIDIAAIEAAIGDNQS